MTAILAELGIDLTTASPRQLTGEAVQAADVVITMGCGDACPVHPGKRYLDWELPDPAGKTIDQVRPIRDQIDVRVRALLAELLPASGQRGSAVGRPARHLPELEPTGSTRGACAWARTGLTGEELHGRHVDEAAVVALERDRDRRGRAVAVLGHDKVCLACPR